MGLGRTIDITAEQRKIVLALLQRHLPNTTAWVYGSRAKWTSSPQSDLDLVVFATPEQNGQVGELREAFEESNLPFRVDLFVWDTVPEQFHKHIKRDHVVLVEREERDVADESHPETLADYFTLQRGTTYQSRLLDQPGPVLLGLATIQRNGGFRRNSLRTYGGESPDKLLVQPGELYVSLKDVTQSADLLGAVARLPFDHPPGRLTQDTVKLASRRADVPIDYLYWLMRTPEYRGYCRAHATGTTNLGLARADFLAFPVPAPTTYQQTIVDTLGTLDDKIELNRRMNETLEAMAHALFKSWFVDFDPVRAKMEGRDTGLPKHLADLFPDRLVDSELGEIPEGWEVKALGDVLELTYGKALKADSRRGGSVPVYGSNGRVGWHDEKLAEGPGIVVGRKGNPGVVNWISTDFFAIDTTFIVLPKGGTQVLPFLFFALKQQDLPSIAADSAVPGLNRHLAYMNRQLIPDAAVVKRFDKQGGIFFTRRSQLEGESHVLATVRDTLLPKLVSGEIRLHAAERAVENIQ